MATVQVQFKGLEKLQNIAKKYPAIAERHVRKAIHVALIDVWNEEKQEAPVRTGHLRARWDTIVGRKGDKLIGTLRSNTSYAIFVHEGTRYQRANPFLIRSAKNAKERVNKDFEEAIGDILNEVAKV